MENIQNKINEIKELHDIEYDQNVKILKQLDELKGRIDNMTKNEFQPKKKRGPKCGGWSWTVKRYELWAEFTDSDYVTEWKLVGLYSSYKEMIPDAQKIYPNIDVDSIKYLVLGKGHRKFQKLRVKYCEKSINEKNKHIVI